MDSGFPWLNSGFPQLDFGFFTRVPNCISRFWIPLIGFHWHLPNRFCVLNILRFCVWLQTIFKIINLISKLHIFLNRTRTLLFFSFVSIAGYETCSIKSIHDNVTLLGGLSAGKFQPMFDEPHHLRDMSREKCVTHCCNDESNDLVFMINMYCYCVKCRNSQMCTPVPITPPSGFHPVAILLHRKTGKTRSPLLEASICTGQSYHHSSRIGQF